MTDTSQDYLRRASIILAVTYVVGFLAVYVLNIALSRLLQSAEYGNFKIAESFIELSTILILLGGGSATFTFLTGRRENYQTTVWGYIRFYSLVVVIVSLIIALGVELYYWWLEGEEEHPLAWAVVFLPVAGVGYLMSCLLHARRHVGYGSVPWEIGMPLLTLAGISLVAVYEPNLLAAEIAITIYGVSLFVVLLIEFIAARRLKILPIQREAKREKPRIWLKASFPMMIASALTLLLFQVDLYMIEAIDPHENCVGYFAAASTTVTLLTVIAYVGVDVCSPLMADALAAGRHEIRALNRKGLKIIALFTLPSTACIAFFSHDLLMLFGEDSMAAWSSLMVLLVGYFFSTLTALPVYWLKYSRHARDVLWILVIAVVINITLNYLLIPRMHIVGAAVGTTVAMIFNNAMLTLAMRKRLGIWAFA